MSATDDTAETCSSENSHQQAVGRDASLNVEAHQLAIQQDEPIHAFCKQTVAMPCKPSPIAFKTSRSIERTLPSLKIRGDKDTASTNTDERSTTTDVSMRRPVRSLAPCKTPLRSRSPGRHGRQPSDLLLAREPMHSMQPLQATKEATLEDQQARGRALMKVLDQYKDGMQSPVDTEQTECSLTSVFHSSA